MPRSQVVATSLNRRWSGLDRQLPVPAPHFKRWGWLNPILALLLLIPGLPIIGILALITRLGSRGSAIYRQTRVGYQGRTFTLYKIRTMSNNAEAETGPVWTAGTGDPRITRLGHWLRLLHLDEFPQLFNVLKGEMNLIGPRPERPEFTQFLAQEIPGYVGRLGVKPGITGLAQINLPPDSDLESVRIKLAADLEYIAFSTLMMDVRILICTALKMFGMKGWRVAKALGLKRRWQERDSGKESFDLGSAHANGSKSVHMEHGPVSLADLSSDSVPSHGWVGASDHEEGHKNGTEHPLGNGKPKTSGSFKRRIPSA